jgi:hypothetical protein
MVSTSRIDLTWMDYSDYEAGFKIERKTGTGGMYSEIATVDANVERYSDTGLNEESLYLYRVRAYHTSGLSLYSNEASCATFSSSGDNDYRCFISTIFDDARNHV